MPEQPKLFEDPPFRAHDAHSNYDPTRPDTHCRICGARFIFDRHGIGRHKPGDGRKCEELMRSRKWKIAQ